MKDEDETSDQQDAEPNNLNINLLGDDDDDDNENDQEEEEENLLYLQQQQQQQQSSILINQQQDEKSTTDGGGEEIRWETPNRYSFVNYEYLQNVTGGGTGIQSK